MPGSLYLIPATLGAEDWQTYLPTATRHIVCNLTRFIAENAKSARAELKRLGHPVPLRQIDIQQLPERCLAPEIERLLEPLLTGEDVGLFSEAGCPGVADPGASIVRRAHAVGIPVKPLVGPSSLLLALMASGLEGQRFAFHGYLPAREPDRRQRIVELERESARLAQTQLFIEAPYRNDVLLEALLAACKPGTRLCLATDLTSAEQTITTRTIGEWRRLTLPRLDRRPTVFLMLG